MRGHRRIVLLVSLLFCAVVLVAPAAPALAEEGAACAADEDCDEGERCEAEQCTADFPPCESDDDCAEGDACIENQCIPPLGTPREPFEGGGGLGSASGCSSVALARRADPVGVLVLLLVIGALALSRRRGARARAT